jgi:hypothetical protein
MILIMFRELVWIYQGMSHYLIMAYLQIYAMVNPYQLQISAFLRFISPSKNILAIFSK